jgi:hypothetical protein
MKNTGTSQATMNSRCMDRFDMKRFSTNSAAATDKVDFMLDRGAIVIDVKATKVRITHSGRTASIDAWGRVSWDV